MFRMADETLISRKPSGECLLLKTRKLYFHLSLLLLLALDSISPCSPLFDQESPVGAHPGLPEPSPQAGLSFLLCLSVKWASHLYLPHGFCNDRTRQWLWHTIERPVPTLGWPVLVPHVPSILHCKGAHHVIHRLPPNSPNSSFTLPCRS